MRVEEDPAAYQNRIERPVKTDLELDNFQLPSKVVSVDGLLYALLYNPTRCLLNFSCATMIPGPFSKTACQTTRQTPYNSPS